MTAAFIDARCRKCGAHIGWYGRVADHPPCPRCGSHPDRARIEADQAEMDNFRELLAELKTANPGWEKWQRARVAAGLTLRNAAKIFGITPSELSEFENCRAVPSVEMVARMSAMYSDGCDLPEAK